MAKDGAVTITVCMGSSCFARGNSENIVFIENYIKEKGLNAKLDLCGTRCENMCASGPHVMVDGKMYSGVTVEMLKAILNKI